MKKKAVAAAGEGARHIAGMESNVMANHLSLLEHCAVVKYDDGDQRQGGWITFKVQGAAWVFQVKDPDSGMSFTVADASFDKALDTVHLLLSCEEAPWSPDPFLKQQSARKKKN